MPVLLERERPSEMQLKAVRVHIMRRRQLERLALAEREAREEAALQRKREQEKKKETVEDVKMEISKLETKLESLKNEKHELFLQLKKVLNEDEQKRQKERQLMAPFHNPMIVHRMPYGMMAQRPFSIIANTAASTAQPLRMEIPSAPGGIKQPASPLIPSPAYPYPPHLHQPSGPQHTPGVTPISEQPPYGPLMTTGHLQQEKHFKVTASGSQPMAANTAVAGSVITPLHVVTNYASSTVSQPSPHNQAIIQQGDKIHPQIKHSPKHAAPSSTTMPHGYPVNHQGETILHQGKPVLNQPGTHQQPSKHQHQHSQHPQISSSSSSSAVHPKHDTTHLFKHSSQPQSKQPTYTSYPPNPEPSQQPVHHKPSNKPQNVQVKTDQHIPQHKHNYPLQPEAVKQDHTHTTRPPQYGVHHYQQQTGGVSLTPSSQHLKLSPQSTSYPTKEPDPKQSFQMSAAPQQSYGYSVQQQASYGEHQPYLNKNQATNPVVAQVSYPATIQQQQNYPGYGTIKDQATTPQYPQQQQHGYQVPQQGYSGQQQYQGYLSQQYQAQPYHGYPPQVEHKGHQSPAQSSYTSVPQASPSTKTQSRPSQFDQSKHDQQMPPPPPQKPPPKPEQEHYHSSQQPIKRSSHRYSSSSHPYKREHHSSSSSKSKFSEKYSSSQDDLHQGSSSQTSRHHYHSSSKSSHSSKGSSSSSSLPRQSKYH